MPPDERFSNEYRVSFVLLLLYDALCISLPDLNVNCWGGEGRVELVQCINRRTY
jgi:hypothetical protein